MLKNPSAPKSELLHEEVVFESDLEPVVDVVISSKARARTSLRNVSVTVRDHPFSINAPRTEELAFARSSGSGGDVGLTVRQHRQRCEQNR